MSATVPVKLMLPVPSAPPRNVSPVVCSRLTVPLVADRLSRTGLPPASTSPMAIWFPVPGENTRGVSSDAV